MGPLYIPTRLNPADGPSRLQEVASSSWGPPGFAATGDLEQLHHWQRYPRQRRGHAPWARLVLKLVVFDRGGLRAGADRARGGGNDVHEDQEGVEESTSQGADPLAEQLQLLTGVLEQVAGALDDLRARADHLDETSHARGASALSAALGGLHDAVAGLPGFAAPSV